MRVCRPVCRPSLPAISTETGFMLKLFARGVAACLIYIALAPPGLSQAPVSAGDRAIALPDAVVRALERSPSLRARGFEITAAEGRLLQSTFRPSPEVSLLVHDVLGTGAYNGVQSAETTASLSWMFERGLRERIVEVARSRIDVSAVEVEIAQLDVAAQTARLFIDCALFQERYRNAEFGLERARDAVTAVRRRVETSRAREAELARAEAELARAELRLDDFAHELLSAYHRLSAQWGQPEPDFDSVMMDLAQTPVVEPFDSLLERVAQNPDLALYGSESRVAEAELSLARARARTSWTVSGGLRRNEASDDWALIGGVTIPLRMGNQNQGEIAATRANLDRLEAAAEAERVYIETELFVLYQELVHNVELAEGLESEVEPRIEGALADTRRAYELGSTSYLEFRAVQTELLEVAYEILDAQANARRLAIEIERLTGESLAVEPMAE